VDLDSYVSVDPEYRKAKSGLLLGRGQVERSYSFDRFHMLRASKSVPQQDYRCCRLGRVCCCKILSLSIEVLCYWDCSGRDCPVKLIYILKDFIFLQASESLPLQEYKFPERRALRLGRVHEGVPVELIYIF